MGIRDFSLHFPNNKIKEPYVSGPLGGACFNFTLFTWHKALEEITTGALKYFYPKSEYDHCNTLHTEYEIILKIIQILILLIILDHKCGFSIEITFASSILSIKRIFQNPLEAFLHLLCIHDNKHIRRKYGFLFVNR